MGYFDSATAAGRWIIPAPSRRAAEASRGGRDGALPRNDGGPHEAGR